VYEKLIKWCVWWGWIKWNLLPKVVDLKGKKLTTSEKFIVDHIE
jgi:hypothetical protein